MNQVLNMRTKLTRITNIKPSYYDKHRHQQRRKAEALQHSCGRGKRENSETEGVWYEREGNYLSFTY